MDTSIGKLEEILGVNEVTYKLATLNNYDYLLTMRNFTFAVEVKTNVVKTNYVSILEKLKYIKAQNKLPVLLIGDYISPLLFPLFINEGINLLDSAGNCYINENNIIVYIKGEKRKIEEETLNSAFNESGIKLIFYFLTHPENIRKSYREMSTATSISLGSIKNVIEDLKAKKFIFLAKGKRQLMNEKKLIEQWQIAYNKVLRPKLFLGKMDFIRCTDAIRWKDLPLDEGTIWGGEPAANLFDGYLSPEIMTLYTNKSIKELTSTRKLRPSQKGKILVYKRFWDSKVLKQTPSFLIYADLMESGDSRCWEAAQRIINNK